MWYVFKTLSLAKHLFSKKTTLVGTVRKTRKFLPAEFCGNSKVIGTGFIHHDSKYTIVLKKPNKSVTLLSSQYHAEVFDDNCKTEIINFYNSTKAGVDTLDQLVRFSTVQRKSRRWPLMIFFNVLDIACYNTFVLHVLKYPEFYHEFKNRSRRKFISVLVDEIKDSFLESSKEVLPPQQKMTKYAKSSKCRCVICPRSKVSKPTTGCDSCKRAMCKSHMWNICNECNEYSLY